MPALLMPEDVAAVRAAAKTEEERSWSLVLESSSRRLLIAARRLIEAAEGGELEAVASEFSRRVRTVEAFFAFSMALDELRGLPATRGLINTILAAEMTPLVAVRSRVDGAVLELLERAREGLGEATRLLARDPYSDSRTGSAGLLPEDGAFERGVLDGAIQQTLLVLALGLTFREDPESECARPLAAALQLRIEADVKRLARRLGLGGTCAVEVEASQLEAVEPDAEDYAPLTAGGASRG